MISESTFNYSRKNRVRITVGDDVINDGGRIRRNQSWFSNYRAISATPKHFQIILSVNGAVDRRNVNIEISNKQKIRIRQVEFKQFVFSSSMNNVESEDG